MAAFATCLEVMEAIYVELPAARRTEATMELEGHTGRCEKEKKVEWLKSRHEPEVTAKKVARGDSAQCPSLIFSTSSPCMLEFDSSLSSA